jgi:hypothetical protein
VGNTVTPLQDFHGTLPVKVVVSDGDLSSAVFTLNATVTAVNDAPRIERQVNFPVVAEDESFTPVVGDLVVTDVDLPLQPLTLAVQDDPASYTHVGNVVTPLRDATGELRVQVIVSDGTASSAVFPYEATLTPVNDAPLITAQAGPLTVAEEGSLTLDRSSVEFSDPDNTAAELTFTVLADPTRYTLTGNTVTPLEDFNGSLPVQVRLDDGALESNPYTLSVTVTPVNDKPRLTAHAVLAIDEDVPLTLTVADLTVVDPDVGDAFTIAVSGGGAGYDYTRSGDTITPKPDFWGTLHVPVTVSDDGAPSLTSDELLVEVTVRKVNKLPVVAADAYSTAGNTELAVTVVTQGVLANDKDRESSLVVGAFDALSAKGGNVLMNADGTFSFRPKAGFTGEDTFTYKARESGNTDATRDVSGTVTVTVVGPVIWYVNSASTSTATPDGRSHAPFKNLTDAGPASAPVLATEPGSIVFVYRGTGTSYGGIVLDPKQQLRGEATGLTQSPNVSIPANPAVVTHIGGTVTVASGGSVSNVNVSSSGDGVVGTGLATVTLVNVPVVAAGEGVRLAGTSAGAATLDNVSVTSNGGRALAVSGFTSLSIPDRSVNLLAMGGAALDLSSIGTVDATVRELRSTNSTQQGLRLVSVGSPAPVVPSRITVQLPVVVSSTQGANVGAQDGVLVQGFTGTLTMPKLDVSGGRRGLVVDGLPAGSSVTVAQPVAITGTSTDGAVVKNSAGTLTLPRLDVTGGQRGLVMENVTGTFALGTSTAVAPASGTLKNTSLAGVVLTNVGGLTLRGLAVQDVAGDGLRVTDGTSVTGLTLSDSTFTRTGTSSEHAALNFGRGGGVTRTAQLGGTVLVKNVNVSTSGGGGLFLESGAGTLSLTLDNLQVSGVAAGSGVFVRADATNRLPSDAARPQLTLLVSNSRIEGLPSGGNGLDVGTEGGPASLTVTLVDSTITNPAIQGNNAVRLAADGVGATFTAFLRRNYLANTLGHVVQLHAGDDKVDVRATLDANRIFGDAYLPGGSPSRSLGNGVRILMDPDVVTGTMNARVLLTNNEIKMLGLAGIEANVRQSPPSSVTSRLDLVATDNNVGSAGTHGLFLRAADSGSTLCAHVSGNPAQGNQYGAQLAQVGGASFLIQGLAPGPATPPAVQTYIANANPALSPYPSAVAETTFAGAPSACLLP